MTTRPPRLRSLLELALLGLVVWLAARTTSDALRLAVPAPLPPPPSAGPAAPAPVEPLDAYRSIAARDLFNGDPTAPAAAAEPLRLWGVGIDGPRRYAVLEHAGSGRQELHALGDAVGEARLVAVEWDHVVLRGPAGEETLPLAEPAADPAAPEATPPAGAAAADLPVRQTSTDAWIVDRTALAGAVDNPSGLLTQLRAVPEVEEGRPMGFRLFQIAGGSIFRQLGLRDGDVVQRVNGTTLADPASLLGFLARLRDEPRVALDIVRGGSARTLVYDLR